MDIRFKPSSRCKGQIINQKGDNIITPKEGSYHNKRMVIDSVFLMYFNSQLIILSSICNMQQNK